jgi:hypothetical protein
MQINRQSYEEYFLLYADGELNESEKKAVEEFIGQNPDLAGELSLIQETVLKPDGSIIFENKELLFKDESDERKVIYMRWFRITAAAAVLISLSLAGWIFLGDRNTHREPVAIVKQPKVENTEPKDILTLSEAKEKPIQQQAAQGEKKEKEKEKEKEGEKQHVNHLKDIQPNNKDILKEPDVMDIVPPAKSIEGTSFTQDVVKSEPGRQTIDVAVEPRAMENNADDHPASNVSYAQSFRQEPDDDMIYFANTSLTKKTKLRGVLRKATRYLDRVTSLQ